MYDPAALLRYRTVKLMARRRIHCPGGDPLGLTPALFPPHNQAARLLAAINERRTRLRRDPVQQLPRQPRAVMLYVILDVLDHTFVQGLCLAEVAGCAEARSWAFQAHGSTGRTRRASGVCGPSPARSRGGFTKWKR